MGRAKGVPRKVSYSLITEMYRAGANASEIGSRLAIHHSTVLYALRGQNIDTSRRAKRERLKHKRAEVMAKALIERRDRTERIKYLYTEMFMSVRQVAETMGMDRRSVYRELIFSGIKIRGAVSPERAEVIARERARQAYLAEQKRARKKADDLRVARMMEIVNRRPMRLAL